jgi:predicted nucleic acid-binding protein
MDNIVLDTNTLIMSISANARFIVTEDRHFDVLKTIDFPKIDVIGIDDFLKTL